LAESDLDWRGHAFRAGSPPREAMAGWSGSGARGAPIEKARPLSLLKVTPIRVMEQSKHAGDVRAGLGATSSVDVGYAGMGVRSHADGGKVYDGGAAPKQIVGTDDSNPPRRGTARTHILWLAVDPHPPLSVATRHSGATDAPMEKLRPLSLLNMPPISRVGRSFWRKALWIGAGTRFERAAHLERPWQAGRVRVQRVLQSKNRGHFPY
jgi:hypothetical protein